MRYLKVILGFTLGLPCCIIADILLKITCWKSYQMGAVVKDLFDVTINNLCDIHYERFLNRKTMIR